MKENERQNIKENSSPKTTTGDKTKPRVQEYIEVIIIAILIAVVIRAFVVQAYKIPSQSMVPTLLVGDHLLVCKFLYGVKIPVLRRTIIPVGQPKRGDIVVFQYPMDRSKDYIKRVIGVEGDKIEIKNKQLFINDRLYPDDHAVHSDPNFYPAVVQPRDNYGPVVVPERALFVMGDNRDASYDSRYWGFVEQKDLEGKALIIYWSWNSENAKNLLEKVRWTRLGTIIR
ncbi:MAG: signal peptidase I [Syntrophaceae bacterium]|jgi:signal peptidase I|nr:signal peptidase I [Syntrophaceae bacterium]